MKRKLFKSALILCILFTCALSLSEAKTWQVGPTKTYSKPSAVVNLVNNGDTVEIDSGLYTGDVAAWNKNNLVLRGTGKYAHLEANGQSSGNKAIWVISGNQVLVENIEFSGCTVADKNGAGIRIEGNGLTVRYCYFHDNENGMLGGSAGSVVVEYSEFAYNGYGDGYSHNIYINHVDSFTLQFCYMHHAKIGHEVKSRASRNYILYNRITNEETGTASREIDLPNGGLAIVLGNIIEQGPNTQNSNMFGYGLEGLTNPVPHDLFVIHNTFVNDRGAQGIFISLNANTAVLRAYNNIFTGQPYTIISGSPISLDTMANLVIPDRAMAGFVNPAGYDYHLSAGSPAIHKGGTPGSLGSFSFTPVFEYVHPAGCTTRVSQFPYVDVGAYGYKSGSGITDLQSEIRCQYHFNEKEITFIINPGKKISDIVVFDISGRLTGKAVCHGGNIFIWDYSGVKDGIYLVRVITENDCAVFKVLVK